FQCELHDARVGSQAGDLAEAAQAVAIARGQAELRSVGEVEDLPAEQQRAALAEVVELARQRKVHQLVAGAFNGVAAAGAQLGRNEVGVSGCTRLPLRIGECRGVGIEPGIHAADDPGLAVAVGEGVPQAATASHRAVVAAEEDGERTPGVESADAAHAPVADDVGNHARVDEFALGAEWQVVGVAEHEALADVEVAASAPLAEIVHVLEEAVGAAAEQMLHGLVNGVRPGIGAAEAQAIAEALVQRQLQAVIAGVADVVAELDRPKRRILVAGGNIGADAAIGIDANLVEVVQDGEVGTFRAYIVGGQDEVVPQHALDAKVPLVDFRLFGFGVHAAGENAGELDRVRQDDVRIERQVEAILEPDIACRAVVVGGGNLVLHQERQVQAELVFAAGAFKQHEEAAIPSAHHGIGGELVGQAHAGSEVVLVGPHQALAIRRVRHGESLAGSGIEVGGATAGLVGPGGEVVAQAEVHGQLGGHLPVVLPETGEHPEPGIYAGKRRKLYRRRIAKQKVGQRNSGTVAVEVIGAAQRRHIKEDVAHGAAEVSTEPESVRSARIADGIHPLKLIGDLRFRQEVG